MSIVCLLICWLPYITICFYETLTGRESPQAASAVATWLVLFTSTLNPWINSMSQTRYRVALRRNMNKIWQRARKNSLSRSTEMCRETHNCPSSVSSAPQALQAHADPVNEPEES
ncbi:histamine H2 receptor [Pangasianodon hypophthalmus]|uniref:histamine H2 receptor n=1 Tax=Pangasianodon hypophthalmus TaxID=310915 RepID=UPI002307C56A|nr:histamine H2 receptor [Pangasianodon hypophthalmus]